MICQYVAYRCFPLIYATQLTIIDDLCQYYDIIKGDNSHYSKMRVGLKTNSYLEKYINPRC